MTETDIQTITESQNGALATTHHPVVVDLEVKDTDIIAFREQFAGLPALVHTRDGYDRNRLAIGTCRAMRGKIENRRKTNNQDALDWQRRNNAEAKRLTALVEEVEEPLKAAKKAVDDERERIKREEEAAALRIIEEAARQKAEQEAAEKRRAEEAAAAERRAQEEAEAAERRRLHEEREKVLEVERARLREQQAQFEKEQKERIEAAKIEAEKQEAARKAIEAQRREIQAERDRLELEQLKARAKEEAKRQAAIEAEAAEQRRLKAEEDRILEAARIEAIKPDVQKVREFGGLLRRFHGPSSLQSVEAKIAVDTALVAIGNIAKELEAFEAR